MPWLISASTYGIQWKTRRRTVATPIATEPPARLTQDLQAVVLSKHGWPPEEAFAPLKLKSRVLCLRSRVPVQRLFVKIFLWFWLTALAMFAVFAVTRMIGLRSLKQSEIVAMFAPKLAAEVANAYESGGAPAFLQVTRSLTDRQKRQLYLLDGFGNEILS